MSFGSKSSVIETWILDDAEVTRRKCGDVREIGGDFYDDTMTSSTDVMVANNKPTNNKIPNRHVTIGDSTYVIMTPDNTPESPDIDDTFAISRTVAPPPSSSVTVCYPTSGRLAGPHHGETTEALTSRPLRSPPARSVSPKEEYYNVLQPEPKDQT